MQVVHTSYYTTTASQLHHQHVSTLTRLCKYLFLLITDLTCLQTLHLTIRPLGRRRSCRRKNSTRFASKKITRPYSPHLLRIHAGSPQSAQPLLLLNILPYRPHGCIPTRLLNIAPAHARTDPHQIIQIEVLSIELRVAKDEFEDATTLVS